MVARPLRLDDDVRKAILGWAEQLMSRRRPEQTLRRDGLPYLERWEIVKSRGAAIENIYIHRFLRSIYEEPHDHPWFNCSVLLIGSYTEWLALPDADGERFVRVPGDVVLRDANLLHSISEVSANTVSLFITGKREREWGFRTVDGWVHWSKFPEWKNLAEGREVIKVRRPTAKEDGQDT